MSDNIKKYRILCEKETSIPIFLRDWWLDATAGEGKWNVILVENGGHIVAVMPYTESKKHGFTILGQSRLTQFSGPWIKSSISKYSNKLGREIKLLSVLVLQLPKFHYFMQNWQYTITNWLPFYWKNFKQTTFYTYVINDLSEEIVWSNFNERVRNDVRKAINRFKLLVRTDIGIEKFIELNDKVFLRQGKKNPYSHDFIRKIDSSCLEKGCRKIFSAIDENDVVHASIYLVWDENSAYYLMGGSDPELRNSGATSLCLWEAIKFSSTVTKKFDFEGSMVEPIEHYFRSFGGLQTPYFKISKNQSFIFKIAKLIKTNLFR